MSEQVAEVRIVVKRLDDNPPQSRYLADAFVCPMPSTCSETVTPARVRPPRLKLAAHGRVGCWRGWTPARVSGTEAGPGVWPSGAEVGANGGYLAVGRLMLWGTGLVIIVGLS